MATHQWRKKASDVFGLEAGRYSHAHGKVDLFADLLEMARHAARNGDSKCLDRIFNYVMWADQQHAENLRSTADIVFFLPMLNDDELLREAIRRVPPDVIESKRAMRPKTAD